GAGEGTVVFAGRYRGAGAKSLSLRGSSFASATLLQDFPDTAPADLAVEREYGRALLREVRARLARSGGDGLLAAAVQNNAGRVGPGGDRRPPRGVADAGAPAARAVRRVHGIGRDGGVAATRRADDRECRSAGPRPVGARRAEDRLAPVRENDRGTLAPDRDE